MNDIDVRRPEQMPIIREGKRNAMFGGGGLYAVGQVTKGYYRHPQAAQRFDVNGANEAGADYAGPELVDWFGDSHKRKSTTDHGQRAETIFTHDKVGRPLGRVNAVVRPGLLM